MPAKSSKTETTQPPVGVFARLKAFDTDEGALNVVIGIPQGSRSSYFKFDKEMGVFRLGGVLPAGAMFLSILGLFSTVGGDGDPLDVLLLMDEAVFPGCLVAAQTHRRNRGGTDGT